MGVGGQPIDDLIVANKNLTSQNDKLMSRNEALNQKVLDLTEKKKDLEGDNKILSKEKNNLDKDKKDLNEKVKQFTIDNTQLKSNNEELQKKIEELENELKRLKGIEEEKTILEKEKDEFKEKYNKEIEDKKFIQIEKENLEKENENLKFMKRISEEANLFYDKITTREIESKIQNKLKQLFDEMLNDESFKKDEFLLENQNFKNKIDQYKKNALNESIEEFLKDTKHINVILLGKTGVGKSSLINALLGRNEADTGGFNPVTDKISFYEENHLRLYDTIGIELSNDRNASNILKEIKNLIKKCEEKDPDWFIHCIWYCVTGDRFEHKEEGKIVDELMNTYKDGKIPIIFAYLQAVDKEAVTKMKKGFHDLYPSIEFIPIVARDIKSTNGMQISKMGLKEIKKITVNKFGESINSMSFVHIQNKVNQRVRQKLDNITCDKNLNYLSNSICNLYKKLLDQLNDKDKNEIEEKVKFIINYSREKLDFNDDIMNYIKDLKNEIYKEENNMNRTQNEIFKKKLAKLKPIEKPELQTIIDKTKKKIEELFNNGINEHNINYKENIYNFFVKKIKANVELHIEESFKNLKNELKEKLKDEIKKSPNFRELLQQQ